MEEYADSKLIDACATLFRERLLKPKMMNEPTDEEAVQNTLENTLPELVAYLESITPESGYLVGNHLSIADIAITTCFIQAKYADYEVDATRAPKLHNYLSRAFTSPLVTSRLDAERAAMPPGLL